MRLALTVIFGAALTACGGGSTSTPIPVPAAPAGLSAQPKDGFVLLKTDPSTDTTITGYNVYWSTISGVNKSNGTKFAAGAATPQAHTGLANGTTYYYVVTAVNAGGESAASKQASATPVAVVSAADPLFGDQWNLQNTGQRAVNGLAGIPGEDIDIAGNGSTLPSAWAATTGQAKGEGVRIAIVDDGLEMAHEDLASNVGANGLSYNYVTGTSDPTNDPTDVKSGHGTACAGIAAARDSNGLGGIGVAPRATVVGYNVLQTQLLSDEIDGMIRNVANVGVSSNSWGASDGYGTLDASDPNWQAAITTGVASGRGGAGTVYLWAAGNGADRTTPPYTLDNSNYDGQANYHGVMAVGAVNDQGVQSSYSESGANLWISAPGGEYCVTNSTGNMHAITTVDRTGATVGFNKTTTAGATDYADTNYTKCMNGTSSATPTMAGVVALVLAAKSTLGWRDVRVLLAETARKNDATNSGWYQTGGATKYHFNPKYGLGVVDAAAAVARAATWNNLPVQQTLASSSGTLALAIPDGNTIGVSNTISVAGSSINSIEFIEVTFSAPNHTWPAELEITLTSPSGTVSKLAELHMCFSHDPNITGEVKCSPYAAWRFGTAGHLGETANGNWTLKVADVHATTPTPDTGSFTGWSMKFYGH